MHIRTWVLLTFLLCGLIVTGPLAHAQEAPDPAAADAALDVGESSLDAGDTALDAGDSSFDTGEPALDATERIRLLREKIGGARDEVAELERKRAARAAANARDEDFQSIWGSYFLATWKDGINLYYLDYGETDPARRPLHGLSFRGVLQAGAELYSDKDHPRNDTLSVGAARLMAEGFFFRSLGYKVEADLEQDGVTKLKDGYINLGFVDVAQLRAGHIQTPIMLEKQKDVRFRNFVELPMIQGIAQLDRDLGVMVHGDLCCLNYQIGVFNGQAPNTVDDDNPKDLAARIQLTPFGAEGNEFAEMLGIGASVTHGHRGTRSKQDGFVPAFQTTSGTTFLAPRGPLGQAGRLTRAGFEAVFSKGPLAVQAEYVYSRIENLVSGAAGEVDLDVEGVYVDVLYMLTQEPYPVGGRVRPDHNFDPSRGGLGAFQVAARYEAVMTESGFARLTANSTDRLDAFTLGLNWYLNPQMKLQLNYQRIVFDDDLRLKDIDRNEDLVFFRLALDF
ncbi:OprO/OprP family phosphate-selective porin [Planctomycetota bacterium]